VCEINTLSLSLSANGGKKLLIQPNSIQSTDASSLLYPTYVKQNEVLLKWCDLMRVVEDVHCERTIVAAAASTTEARLYTTAAFRQFHPTSQRRPISSILTKIKLRCYLHFQHHCNICRVTKIQFKNIMLLVFSRCQN